MRLSAIAAAFLCEYLSGRLPSYAGVLGAAQTSLVVLVVLSVLPQMLPFFDRLFASLA